MDQSESEVYLYGGSDGPKELHVHEYSITRLLAQWTDIADLQAPLAITNLDVLKTGL